MIPGQSISRAGVTTDSKYIYMANIQLDDIGPSSNNHPFHLHVGDLNDVKNKNIDPKMFPYYFKDYPVSLPFRLPVLVHKSVNLNSLSSDLKLMNSDFGTNIDNSNTPTKGSYNELTTNTNIFDSVLIKRSGAGTIIPRQDSIEHVLFSKVISASPLETATYSSWINYLIGYPTSVQLHARESGGKYYLYIVYNYKVVCNTNGVNMKWLNGIGDVKYSNPGGTTVIPDAYNNTITYTWETPIVAKYEYLIHQYLFFKNISYPTATYSKKVDSDAGNYAWNARVIPTKYITTTGTNKISYGFPSNNRCFVASFYDADYNRLVVATVYEKTQATPDATSIVPYMDTLYISYFDLSSALTATPTTGPVEFIIRDTLAAQNMSTRIDNIHKISMTKVWGNYVVSISYDTIDNSKVSLNTILVKIDAATALTSANINYFNSVPGAGFADVFGIGTES